MSDPHPDAVLAGYKGITAALELRRMHDHAVAAYMQGLLGVLYKEYCRHCWAKDPHCQCTNDE